MPIKKCTFVTMALFSCLILSGCGGPTTGVIPMDPEGVAKYEQEQAAHQAEVAKNPSKEP